MITSRTVLTECQIIFRAFGLEKAEDHNKFVLCALQLVTLEVRVLVYCSIYNIISNFMLS
jgi:hypothetical protein